MLVLRAAYRCRETDNEDFRTACHILLERSDDLPMLQNMRLIMFTNKHAVSDLVREKLLEHTDYAWDYELEFLREPFSFRTSSDLALKNVSQLEPRGFSEVEGVRRSFGFTQTEEERVPGTTVPTKSAWRTVRFGKNQYEPEPILIRTRRTLRKTWEYVSTSRWEYKPAREMYRKGPPSLANVPNSFELSSSDSAPVTQPASQLGLVDNEVAQQSPPCSPTNVLIGIDPAATALDSTVDQPDSHTPLVDGQELQQTRPTTQPDALFMNPVSAALPSSLDNISPLSRPPDALLINPASAGLPSLPESRSPHVHPPSPYPHFEPLPDRSTDWPLTPENAYSDDMVTMQQQLREVDMDNWNPGIVVIQEHPRVDSAATSFLRRASKTLGLSKLKRKFRRSRG